MLPRFVLAGGWLALCVSCVEPASETEACEDGSSWAALTGDEGLVDHVAADGASRVYASTFGTSTTAFDCDGNVRWSRPWSADVSSFQGPVLGLGTDGTSYVLHGSSVVVLGERGNELRRARFDGVLLAVGVTETDSVVVLLDAGGDLSVVTLTPALVEAWRTPIGQGPPAGTTGPFMAVSPGGRAAFAWRAHVGALSPTGELLWARDVPVREMHAVDIDPAGRVAIGGAFDSNPDFGGGELGMSLNLDAFVVVYEPDGQHGWSRALRSESFDYSYGVAFRDDGGVVATGHFGEGGVGESHLDVGGDVRLVSPANDRDVFVVAYDARGALDWALTVPGEREAAGRSIANGPRGEVIVGGLFSGSIDLDGHVLTVPAVDAAWAPFVWRFVPD